MKPYDWKEHKMEFVVTDRLLDTQPLLPTPWWRKWLVRWGVLKPRYGRPLREVLDIEKEDTPHLDDVDDLDVVADPDPYVSFSWGPPTGSEAEHSGPRAMRLKPSEPEMIINGFSVLFDIRGWADLPVDVAVGYVMRATNGSVDPKWARKVFMQAVQERGLEPME